MKRKPLEKLSNRLARLFLNCVKNYDIFYIDRLNQSEDCRPIELAWKMSTHIMNMIAEYEPEDIE